MISVEGLKVEFGVKPLFSDVTFVVNSRDRIALVGKNGAGKSTMLKILSGMEKPSAGIVSMVTDTTVGYLPQVMILQDDTTVREEAQKAFADIQKVKDHIDRMERQLNERTDYESRDYMELVERFTNEHERYQMLGAEGYESEIERTLSGLGFSRSDLERPTSEFSGGWRMRIELAKILLRRPDVLLLDEPTNHLDIESIQWLEQLLAGWSGAVILVSHDRAFINNVTNRTLEISCGKVIDYRVKYDEYVVLRKERREQQLRAYENQQKEMADIRDFVERFRYKPTKAVQVQQRLRQLNGGRTFDYIKEHLLADQRNSGYIRIYYDYVPDAAAATINQASEYLQQERYNEALQLLQGVKNDPRAQNALGVALWHTGNQGEAFECFRRAAENGDDDGRENFRQLVRQLER